ncbi:hypothetical protein [Kitasatospora sp. NPDC088346]|uniref:hypothetical protein n=1 Tax=Kitasatospora sp. NPDC088346 TaxID=3364073 RepID=UPI00381912AB
MLAAVDPAAAGPGTRIVALAGLGVPGERIPPDPAGREARYRSALHGCAQSGRSPLIVADDAASRARRPGPARPGGRPPDGG